MKNWARHWGIFLIQKQILPSTSKDLAGILETLAVVTNDFEGKKAHETIVSQWEDLDNRSFGSK